MLGIKYVTGKTVEEAMASASEQYGNEREVNYEIEELPKKGFLGIGAAPAKIKVTYETDDTASELAGIVSELKNLKYTTDRGYEDEAPKKSEPKQPKQEKQPKPQPKPQPKAEKPQPKAEAKKQEPKEREKSDTTVTPEEMACALEFARTLIANMHIDAQVVQAGEARIEIIGDNTSILIGHHGETLDALQYLINLCVCRRSGSGQREFVKIVVDIENYREKREETLRALARRMAAKAVKYKRNIILEPMNPYERRIIHSEVQDIENVSTHSVGSDENRKIVIAYEGADKADRRGRHSRYRKSSGAGE